VALNPGALEELALTQGPAQPMPDDGVDDGTRQLLRAGIWILVVGGLAALLTATLFGGIGRHGPHTNSGWLSLLLAMMCLPFGSMLTLLGAAKWLRNRRLARVQRNSFD
jgi:drug/metabolite transporter (DMT)-like permease